MWWAQKQAQCARGFLSKNPLLQFLSFLAVDSISYETGDKDSMFSRILLS
jgi:hypothetical protein